MDQFDLQLPHLTIACKAWGDKRLPPILALHGWLDNANSFEPIAPYLLDNFYLIAIDLPGHGLSSHIAEGFHYHFIDGIFTIVQIIDALGNEKIHLLGHSLGACLASLVAGVIPEKILSLALIEALGPFSSPDYTCQTQLVQYVQKALRDNNKDAKPYPSMALAAEARAKRGHLSLNEARILCERGVDNKDGIFYWRHDRRLIYPTALRMTEGQILSCLTAITAKSCLIWADNGFNFDKKEIQPRLDAVKNLIVYEVEGGHHVHMEKPDTVAQCLAEFYKVL